MKKLFIGAILAVILIGTLAASIYVVPVGHAGVLVTLGKVNLDITPYGEGWNFKAPYIQDIVNVDVRTQTYGVDTISTSQDLQDVNAGIILQYDLNSINANRLYQSIGMDYESKIIHPLMKQSIKEQMAKFQAEDLIQDRGPLADMIAEDLSEKLRTTEKCVGCIHLQTISIENLEFSTKFSDAIELKATAIQEADKARNDLVRIQVEAEQALALAEGQANAIREVEKALSESPNYVKWLATTLWDGKLPLATGDGVVPFINIPTG